MIHWENEVREDETIPIGSDDVYYLGPNLTLRGCTLVLSTTEKAFTIVRTQLIDCSIDAKKKLTNFRWNDAFLKGCRLSGTYSGCDFGRWPEFFDPSGGIEACDFSQAICDGVRLIHSNVDSMTLPVWPSFTVVEPWKQAARIQKIDWPGKAKTLGIVLASFEEETSAVIYNAALLAKKYAVAEDEIKAAIARIEGVRF